MNHPPEEWIQDYSDGKLAEHRVVELENHLIACEICRQRLSVFDEYRKMKAEALKENQEPLAGQ